jgi:hypothetical protein
MRPLLISDLKSDVQTISFDFFVCTLLNDRNQISMIVL